MILSVQPAPGETRAAREDAKRRRPRHGYNRSLIVTLTINPAIDRILSVDRLAFEDRAYINSIRQSAGGRGLNASSVIHSFGGQTQAVLISGGASGKRLEGLLEGCGYPIVLVPVKNSIRTNLTITDKQGLTVNLNEVGPALTGPELAKVERAVRQALDGADWLMLCGSTPPGVPSSFCTRAATRCAKASRRGRRWRRRTSPKPSGCWGGRF